MRIKKSHLAAAIILVILIIISSVFYLLHNKGRKSAIGWKVSESGILSFDYGADVISDKKPYNENEYFTIEKVSYQSKGAQIYGLLVTPYANWTLPGIVLLPGAGVSKESELKLASTIASLGFIVFTIDQRGVGESKAALSNLDEDFGKFMKGEEPFQHLMVYDAILAAKILNQAPGIEKGSIYMAGESLGGRNAMIAAAIYPEIKGVISISASGLGFPGGSDMEKDRFIKSLDPDNYVRMIAPRRFIMVHNVLDDKVPFDAAVETYKKAQMPKNFLYVNSTECRHGYCDSMHPALKTALYGIASAEI